ncbi:hypothetical protein M1513_01300, partial [Patescibacteria group bacterium]|nr:hypothetical protein [Patescibacteria group bacterium]
KFVSKETLAGSTDKDYVEQTRILRDHLDKNGLLTDKERDECSDKILDKLKITMSKDWESAAKTLSELEINKNHRRTPSEALYDSSIVLLSRGKKLLENNYDWTSVRSSGGWLVFVGPFGSDGLSVYYAKPGRSSSYLGVCPSR